MAQTLADRLDLERVQKAAVKVILGKDYLNYEDALSELKLESLYKRREAMALKFVKKSMGNSFQSYFLSGRLSMGWRLERLRNI